MRKESRPAGVLIEKTDSPDLYILEKGSVRLKTDTTSSRTLSDHDSFGEEGILLGTSSVFLAETLEDTDYYVIPGETLRTIPIIQIKLLEIFKRRMSGFAASFSFVWKKRYEVGIPSIDQQHKTLFSLIEKVTTPLGGGNEDSNDLEGRLGELLSFAREHFAGEEEKMIKTDYAEYERQKSEHEKILKELDDYYNRLCTNREDTEVDFLEYLKGWIVTHTLAEDRKYGPFFKKKGLSLKRLIWSGARSRGR